MLHKLARYRNGVFQSFAPLKTRKKVIRDFQRIAQTTNMGILYELYRVDEKGNKIKLIFSVSG